METTMNLKPHPAAERFPMLEGAELQALADDISANGLQEPITLYSGDILDGRNRYRACQMAGIEPRVVDYNGPLSPQAFVISMNIRRRHLTVGQIAAILLPLKEEFREAAEKRQETSTTKAANARWNGNDECAGSDRTQRITGSPVGRVNKIVADIGGISSTSMKRMTLVAKTMPDLVPKVESGEMTLEAAYKLVGPWSGDEKPGTPKIKSPKMATMEANCRQRVFDSLASLDGACIGLSGVNVNRLIDATDEADRNAMLASVQGIIGKLNKFKRSLSNAATTNGNQKVSVG